MIRVIVSGRLYGAPVQRTGQSGKPFVTGKLRVDTGEETPAWASVIAFGDSSERLGALKDGDAVSLAGRATLQGFLGKDGVPKASLSIVADEIAAVRSKAKAVDAGRSHPSVRGIQPAATDGGFGDMADDLPWAGQA